MKPNHLHARLRAPAIQLLILIAVSSPYFINLGTSSLWDANEAFYAETPREMMESGDYLAPQFNYAPRAQKPPLSYWIVLLSYKIFGVSEFAVRFPGALAALGVLLFTYAIGRHLFSPVAGILALVLLGSTVRVFILARRLPIDIFLLFWISGAIFFLVRALKRDSTAPLRAWLGWGWSPSRDLKGTVNGGAPGWWVLFYLFLGLGFLTKGPVAVLIPLGSYLLWALWGRRFSLAAMHPVTGTLVFAAVVLPWYIRIYQAHGWSYIAPFFLKDNLARFATESFGPDRGPLYYVGTFAADFFPWSLLALILALYLWSARKSWPREHSLEFGFPLLACGFIFVLFSLSKNKQEYYIAPLYPLMAVLVAGVVERTLLTEESSAQARWGPFWSWVLFALSILLFGLAMVVLAVLPAMLPDLPVLLRFVPSVLLLLASFALAWHSIRGSVAPGLVSLAVSIWFLIMLSAWIYIPAAESYRPVKEMCKVIEAQAKPDDNVGYFRTTVPSMVFYLRRPIFEEIDPEAMVRRFQSPQPVYCLLTEQDYSYFVGQRDLILYVLERRSRLITQLRLLLDETSWPAQEFLLVSNQPLQEAPTREGQENP